MIITDKKQQLLIDLINNAAALIELIQEKWGYDKMPQEFAIVSDNLEGAINLLLEVDHDS